MLLLEHLANVLERLAADALDLAQTLVSERIKGRECYRPLAPIVTDKEFDRLFVGPRGKFMQYSVHCTNECKRVVPAIVHTDNTCRPPR